MYQPHQLILKKMLGVKVLTYCKIFKEEAKFSEVLRLLKIAISEIATGSTPVEFRTEIYDCACSFISSGKAYFPASVLSDLTKNLFLIICILMHLLHCYTS